MLCCIALILFQNMPRMLREFNFSSIVDLDDISGATFFLFQRHSLAIIRGINFCIHVSAMSGKFS